ncbi:MAG: aminotransferase class V-fold PLP-dependent enzyme [Clostridia bacterium]|nr:aminotransferase class V-fold PLP-dependent enzyme [Clostridia bacterium]
MEIVYLDNSATTAVCPAAAQKALDMMTRCYGNPSSLHTMGIEAEKEMTAAREALACKLDVPADCIRFTSGGTEANNLAVLGAAAALAHSSRYAVTTAIEHPSVARCFDQLEAQGWTVTRLRPEADGTISAGALLQACRPDTALISMMLVNNETGALLPILSALPAVRRAAP